MINVNLLPKNLRRVREPGYWKFIAVAFPLLVFAIAFAFQFSASQTERNLTMEVRDREDRLALLQPALREQAELQARLNDLRRLIGIRNEVRDNTMIWTDELFAMLETLPPQGNAPRPPIQFNSVNLSSVVPPRNDPARYEGQPYGAEMSISGQVVSTEILADYVRALENSRDFGVSFQSATRQEDEDIYQFSLTVGSLLGESDAQ